MRPITWQQTAVCTQDVKGNHQVFQFGAHLRLRRTAQFRHLQLSTTCSFACRSFLFLAEVWAKLPLAGQSSEMNALGMLLGSSVLMIPTALWMDGLPSFNLMMSTWSALLALSVLCTSVPYLLYFKILKRAGSGNLMLVTLLIPPVAIGLGITFRQTFTGCSACGLCSDRLGTCGGRRPPLGNFTLKTVIHSLNLAPINPLCP